MIMGNVWCSLSGWFSWGRRVPSYTRLGEVSIGGFKLVRIAVHKIRIMIDRLIEWMNEWMNIARYLPDVAKN